MIWWDRLSGRRRATLDGRAVESIASDLWPQGSVSGSPFRLPHQSNVVGRGQEVGGKGFVLDKDQKDELITYDPRSREVVFPVVTGSDLNKSPTHASDRWVINFRDWSVDRAAERKGAYDIVERNVKPERRRSADPASRQRWWSFRRYAGDLVARVHQLERVVVMAQVSSRVVPVLVRTGPVFTHKVIIFPWNDMSLLGVLSSTLHRVWVDRYSSTMKSDVSYSPTDCFDTYPFPGVLRVSDEAPKDGLTDDGYGRLEGKIDAIEDVMSSLNAWRASTMRDIGDGITKLYGRYHDPTAEDPRTTELRERHIELDGAVRDAYGWNDLELGHDFHMTRYGTFFTVSTSARFELLMRLLELNFEQYADQTSRPLDEVVEEAQRSG